MAEMEAKKDELLSEVPDAREKLHVLFDEMMQMCLWYETRAPLILLSLFP